MSAHMISAGVFITSMVALSAARIKEVSMVQDVTHPLVRLSQVGEVDHLVFKAELAEKTERYDDMVKFMRQFVVKSHGKLTVEQRNLLSVAYKNVVGARRSSWRTLSSIADGDDIGAEESLIMHAKQYSETMMDEVKTACRDILDLIDTHLLQAAPNLEAKVFFQKMKGDYYRYMAEVSTGADRAELTTKCWDAYLAAKESSKSLASTHPTRLGLALNYSVFLYEVASKASEAIDVAKKAFDEALASLDELDEKEYRDSTLIMQLLRDNLTIWNREEQRARDR